MSTPSIDWSDLPALRIVNRRTKQSWPVVFVSDAYGAMPWRRVWFPQKRVDLLVYVDVYDSDGSESDYYVDYAPKSAFWNVLILLNLVLWGSLFTTGIFRSADTCTMTCRTVLFLWTFWFALNRMKK